MDTSEEFLRNIEFSDNAQTKNENEGNTVVQRTIYKATRKNRKRFTQIENESLYDARLSYRATGLLVYLISLPDNFVIHKEKLYGFKKEGRQSVMTAFKELITAGYIIEVKNVERSNQGRFATKKYEYIIYEVHLLSKNFEEIYGEEEMNKRLNK